MHDLCSHPEIEFRAAELVKNGPIVNVNVGIEGRKGSNSLVDVLEIHRDKVEWRLKVDHQSLLNLVPYENPLNEPQPLRIFFFEDFGFLSQHAPDQYPYTEVNSTGHWMRQLFGVSPLFLTAATRTYGEIRGNGCFVRRDAHSREVALDGFYHFSSGKGRSTSIWFSHSLLKNGSSTYIVHKFPEDARGILLRCYQQCKPELLRRPLAIDACLAECILLHWERAWDGHAAELKQYESEYKSTMTPSETAHAIESLHYLSRALYGLQGHLADFQDAIQHFFGIHQSLLRCAGTDMDEGIDSVKESFNFLQSKAHFVARWTGIHRERVGVQINLFFNLANQFDSRTNLEIAKLTSKISVSTQRDSSAMITIAVVTMFFLPGTFISAFFSMVFFDTKPDTRGHPVLVVGPQLWIYVLATVMLTILVLCIWGSWQYHRVRHQAKSLDVETLAGVALNRNDNKTQLVAVKEKPE
ncbi:hypothetical protein NLJ89_g2806 [Agrocybe chaxingu]|uniref:Uncharacterized protein n=1 Tax=Agrocybe chaxingu TaxID=84603 RepID=A0A9W8K577_9AGAR|nr:hypothetical protein NLJ89_g2806 [Agrocybe chaxingu]